MYSKLVKYIKKKKSCVNCAYNEFQSRENRKQLLWKVTSKKLNLEDSELLAEIDEIVSEDENKKSPVWKEMRKS